MSKGKKVAIAAMGVLAIAVVGYYGLREPPQQAGGSAKVKLPDDSALPPPDAPGQLSHQDPALTHTSPAPSPTPAPRPTPAPAVSPTSPSPAPTPAPAPLIKPLELVNLSPLSTPSDAPTPTPTPAPSPPPAPAAASTEDPIDSSAPVGLPIVDDPVDSTQPSAGDPAAQVRPVPVDVLEHRTDVAPLAVTGTRPSVTRPVQVPTNARTDSYVVQENDNLWAIAQKTLGAGHKWQLIAQANPGVDPSRLSPGTVLIIPATAPAAVAPSSPRAVDRPTAEDPLGLGLNRDMREVEVGPNDSLWSIAQREYNDGAKWKILFEANKDRLTSPDDLRLGQKLRVPPLP